MITVYTLDAQNIFAAAIQIDPLDRLPAPCTLTEPPPTTGTQVALWTGSEWLVLAKRPPAPEPAPAPAPDPKLVGVLFEGVRCSATREDQNGLMAVLLAHQLQGAAFKPTVFFFANGNQLVLSAANIPAFAAVWMPFRQGFFLAAGA
jgi:hypothetical protein